MLIAVIAIVSALNEMRTELRRIRAGDARRGELVVVRERVPITPCAGDA